MSECLRGTGLQAFTLKNGGLQGSHVPSAVFLPVPAVRPLHASTQGPRGVFPDLQPGHPFYKLIFLGFHFGLSRHFGPKGTPLIATFCAGCHRKNSSPPRLLAVTIARYIHSYLAGNRLLDYGEKIDVYHAGCYSAIPLYTAHLSCPA